TAEAGAKLRGAAAPLGPDPGKDPLFDRRIEEPQWGDPLTLMLAGLANLGTGVVGGVGRGRKGFGFGLAGRGSGRWGAVGVDAPAGLMTHMAAYVTVSGGLSAEELRQAAKDESEAIGRAHPGGWRALADAVGEALQGGAGARAVKPDVVGEALLLVAWGGA